MFCFAGPAESKCFAIILQKMEPISDVWWILETEQVAFFLQVLVQFNVGTRAAVSSSAEGR